MQAHSLLLVHSREHKENFDWLEISIVYDKSFHHTTIYDSYHLEIASKLIKTIKFENTSTTYS